MVLLPLLLDHEALETLLVGWVYVLNLVPSYFYCGIIYATYIKCTTLSSSMNSYSVTTIIVTPAQLRIQNVSSTLEGSFLPSSSQ